jgi:hypothetical protein
MCRVSVKPIGKENTQTSLDQAKTSIVGSSQESPSPNQLRSLELEPNQPTQPAKAS